MASDALVDVSYHGLVLGKGLRLTDIGPRSAYVACDAPMPVGSELVLVVDGTVQMSAQVARVQERASEERPVGMWIWAEAAGEPAHAWWDEHVTAADPVIPEPGGGGAGAGTEAAPEGAEAAPEGAGSAGHQEAAEGAGDGEAEDREHRDPESAAGADQGEAEDREHRDPESAAGADQGEDAPEGEIAAAGAGAGERAEGAAQQGEEAGGEGHSAGGTADEAEAAAASDASGDTEAEAPRERRVAQVMSAVEVDAELAGDEPSAPAPDGGGESDKPRGKKRRRRKRR